ncbi:divalent metal cation transporter [Paraburkholderia sp. MMS20-SJTR3]|uniref:Divalent metal cation transporter n=1 Tax=Paraburkholderia sejongensis TaxID=2886946 RepID=A0ABS8JNJ4_9BURK|nr:divalent metal cation transporter [Paraburkholderia sp. MMS20-SJTR3]MCC8391478.1 divalent metal cation transporter [Paraburkholderia sp. MMS20-SJTR3]
MQSPPDRRTARRATPTSEPTRSSLPARSWAADLGPGLVSLGCDNDPSGIATYSLAGAWYGYDMLWTCVLTYPSMVALQLVSARIAAVTGHGLTANMRAHYSPVLFYFAVARFVLANTLNIAVDVLAMATVAQRFVHLPLALLAVACGGLSIALQWFIPYARYARIVKWLMLPMLAYGAVLLIVDVPWHTVALRSFVPRIEWQEDFVTMLMAVLGTTMSPYLLFSQAEQEAQHEHREQRQNQRDAAPQKPQKPPKPLSSRQLRRLRTQTLIRTALSSVAALGMMIAAAATLHGANARPGEPVPIARALEPLAHGYAGLLLGLALFGSALLALPPLAGSAAQAVASSFDWPRGKQRDGRIAGVLVALAGLGTLLALALGLSRIDPLKAMYWSAVVNGMSITPVLVLLVLLGAKREAVGEMAAHWSLRALCWLATLLTGVVVAAHFVLEAAARIGW